MKRGSLRGQISVFRGKSTGYSIGMLYRQIDMAPGGALQILYGKILMYITLYKPMGPH